MFVASAKPHIISGNLRVFFSDSVEDPRIPLKYLPPQWIENDDLVNWILESGPPEFKAGTTIFLPLRSELIRNQLRQELHLLPNTLPIFLSKLQYITLAEDNDQRTLYFSSQVDDRLQGLATALGRKVQVSRGVDQNGEKWLLCTSKVDMSGIEESAVLC